MTLAKMIYKSKGGKELFRSVESIRVSIRYYRGKMGKDCLKKLSDKSFVKEAVKNFGIPDGEREDMSAFIMPKSLKRALIINDVHIPYHDAEALSKALQYGLDYSADCIIINGDFLDFYKISRFEIDPRARSLKHEIETARIILGKIRDIYPDVPIYFKMGNHEMRWESYLKIKAPELLDMEEFRLDVILHFRSSGIINVTGLRAIKFGKLNILHGHEYRGGMIPPVNIARGYLLKAKDNILVGHHHRTSEQVQRSVTGTVTGAWSVGHLGEAHPAYMPFNEWNHGFALVTIDDNNGNFTVHNKKIINGNIS
jgi:predicted phosphodiesterase